MMNTHKRSVVGLTMLTMFCAQSAAALPIPGMTTFEASHCISWIDIPVDPIKSPGISPSAHDHTHYGIFIVGPTTSAKPIADGAQRGDATNPIQNVPGGGQSTILDPGYGPFLSSCLTYSDWAWYAIPTPRNNGVEGQRDREWGWWLLRDQLPRTVGVMTETWAAPIGAQVYEPPFGMTAIIGNAEATSEAEQDNTHVYWTCGDLVTKSSAPRDCSSEWRQPGGGGLVTAVVAFPNCWDGQNAYPRFDVQMGIDRKHFYYSDGNGSCGTGVMIAQLFLSVNFGDLDTRRPMVNPLNADGSMKLDFASGPYYTFHSDFGNLWGIQLGWWVAGCLNGQDFYGGFQPLTVFAPRCPLPACPAQSVGDANQYAAYGT